MKADGKFVCSEDMHLLEYVQKRLADNRTLQPGEKWDLATKLLLLMDAMVPMSFEDFPEATS